jgi:hypothetical protein
MISRATAVKDFNVLLKRIKEMESAGTFTYDASAQSNFRQTRSLIRIYKQYLHIDYENDVQKIEKLRGSNAWRFRL